MARIFNRQAVFWAAGAAIAVLLISDASWFFTVAPPTPFSWLRVGFSAFTAFLFLLIGSFVWCFAALRHLARMVLVFCLAMSVTMAVETGAASGSVVFTAISTISSAAAISSLLLFLLLFPHNYLASAGPWTRVLRIFVRGTLVLGNGFVLLLGLCWLVGVWARIFDVLEYSYDLLLLFAVLVVLVMSYLRAETVRAKGQLRLFVGGVLLAILPFVVLTLLPEALGLPARYQVDSQLSTIGVVLIPLALGYCVLRSQILVREVFVRRFVARGVALVCLGLFAYGVVVVSSQFLAVVSAGLLPLACGFAVLIVLGWQAVQRGAERLLFPEIWYLRRLVLHTGQQVPSSVDHVCLLLVSAASMVESSTTCSLFVLDEQTGAFARAPQHPAPSAALADTLAALAAVESASGQLVWRAEVKYALEETTHPLFVSDLVHRSRAASGIGQYLQVPDWQDNPLLVPLRADTALIGVLMLTKRAGEQPSVAPDCEALLLLAEHYSPLLQQARLLRASRRAAVLLTTFYSMSNVLAPEAFSSVRQAAEQWAEVAAEAIGGSAHVAFWLPADIDASDAILVQTGPGPLLSQALCQHLALQGGGQDWYREGSAASPLAGELAAVAVLPLRCRDDPAFGFLLLAFGNRQPRHFLQEEKPILHAFAGQCATGLDAVQALSTSRRQDEAQTQHDQASLRWLLASLHALRQSFGQVQGHQALLREEQLSEAMREKVVRRTERAGAQALLRLQVLARGLEDDDQLAARPSSRCILQPLVQEAIELALISPQFDGREIRQVLPADLCAFAPEESLRVLLWLLVQYQLSNTPATGPVWVRAEEGTGQVWIKGGWGTEEYLDREFAAEGMGTRNVAAADAASPLAQLALCQRLVAAMGARLLIGDVGQNPVFLLCLPSAGEQACQPLAERTSA